MLLVAQFCWRLCKGVLLDLSSYFNFLHKINFISGTVFHGELVKAFYSISPLFYFFQKLNILRDTVLLEKLYRRFTRFVLFFLFFSTKFIFINETVFELCKGGLLDLSSFIFSENLNIICGTVFLENLY